MSNPVFAHPLLADLLGLPQCRWPEPILEQPGCTELAINPPGLRTTRRDLRSADVSGRGLERHDSHLFVAKRDQPMRTTSDVISAVAFPQTLARGTATRWAVLVLPRSGASQFAAAVDSSARLLPRIPNVFDRSEQSPAGMQVFRRLLDTGYGRPKPPNHEH